MTWGKPPRYTSRTPTQKDIRAAYAMQAPLDAPVKPLAKPKRVRREDDALPDWDGIGGTDK